MRGFQRPGGASGPAGGTDTCKVQPGQQRNAVGVSNDKGDGVRQAILPRSDELDSFQSAKHSTYLFGQRPESIVLKDRRLDKVFECFNQAYDRGKILRAGPPLIFVGTAEQDRVWT